MRLAIGPGLAAAETLAGEEDQSVDEQEHRGGGGFGEDGPEGVFQGDPGQPDGDGGDHDHPGQTFVAALDGDAAGGGRYG